MVKKNRKKVVVIAEPSLEPCSDKSDDEQDRQDDDLKCKYCDCLSLNVRENKKHEETCKSRQSINVFVTFNGEVKFVCPVCNQIFKYQTGLKKHELRHKPPGGFICFECKAPFLTDVERSVHKQDVHKMFKCLICNDKFTSEKTFQKHIDELHEGRDREYVTCDDCGAQFRQKNQLKLHTESKCGTVRCYQCKQCDSRFMTQNTLNAHSMIHTGEKKHLCDFCGNAFLSRGQLKIHERSHTGEKPYECNVCKKSFAHRESLVTHSSIHTGIKPFMCECCKSKFSCIGNLIKHRRTRPQSCGLPKYKNNVKCAPRASTKVAGRLTMKVECRKKRTYSKRKAAAVAELLSSRVETKRENKTLNIITDEQNPEINTTKQSDCNYSDVPISIEENVCESNSFEVKEECFEEDGGEIVEIIDPPAPNTPINCNPSTISYNMSKNNILIMTDHGNYILTGNALSPKPISTPSGQIIILNADQFQYGNHLMGQSNLEVKTIDGDENVELITEDESIIETEAQDVDEVVMEQQFNDSNIEHFEIIEAEEEVELEDEFEEKHDISLTEKEPEELHIIEVYECDQCEDQFQTEEMYLKHLKMDHDILTSSSGDKKFLLKCQFCAKKYSSQNLLNKHISCHGVNGELIHKCSCCPLYFATKQEAQEHSMKEHEDRLKCTYCNKVYKDLDCISAHIRKLHTKTAAPQKKYTFVCIKCGKNFNSRVALSDHEQSDCGRSPIYKCNDCNKCLHSAGSLKTHQLIHSGDLPHSCSFCDKRFRTQGQVKVHERSHNGQKPFACDQCSKSFAHRESLLTHMSLHTGIKRFLCQPCGKRFSCISNLKAHRRTHKQSCGQTPLDTTAQYTYNLENGSVSITQNKVLTQ